MKSLKPLFFFLLFPVFGLTQSLNGVYTGVLSNDSTTIRKDQSFEMALTEYNNKVYGYAYSTFIVNDTLYYIVKRVKGKVDGDICEVEDDEVISHNFPQKPEKKVFVTYTLRRNTSDSIWRLDGNWKTNVTKKYYAISGNVETKEEKDLAKSKLYEHLGDLDLQKTLVLSRPKEKIPDTKTTKTADNKPDIAKNTAKKEDKKNTETRPVDAKSQPVTVKAETKVPDNKTKANPNATRPDLDDKTDVSVAKNNTVPNKKTETVAVKTVPETAANKITTSSNPPVQNEKKDIASSNSTPVDKKPENNIAQTNSQLPANKTVPAATNDTKIPDVNKDIANVEKTTTDKKTESPVVKTETKVPDNKIAISSNPPVQNEKKDDVTAKTDRKNEDKKSNIIAANNTVKPGDDKNTVAVNPNSTVKTESKPPPQSNNAAINNTVTKQDNNKTVLPSDTKPVTANTENKIAKTEPKTADNKTINPVTTQPSISESKNASANEKKSESGYEFQEINRVNRTLKPASSLVDERVSIPSETIFFTSDSLSIALYDNGEVDGDTVSVIINDELFIEKQGLKSSAYRKTFHIPPGQGDSLLVVLYAENLGKYPPNTGLLQIKDGEEIFYVRFKADLDKNAAIVLRRRSR